MDENNTVVQEQTTTQTATPAVETTQPQTNTLVDAVDNISANYNISTEEAVDSLNRTELQTDANAYTTLLENTTTDNSTNATCLNDYATGAVGVYDGETPVVTNESTDEGFKIYKPEDIPQTEDGIYDLSSIYQKGVEAIQEQNEAAQEIAKMQYEQNVEALKQQVALGITSNTYQFAWGSETIGNANSGYSGWSSGWRNYSGRSYYRRWRNYGWRNYRRWSNWSNYGYSTYEDPYLEGLNEDEATALWGMKALYGESEMYDGTDWDEAAKILSMGDYDLEEASSLLTKWHGAIVQKYRQQHVDEDETYSAQDVINYRRDAGIEAPHIRTMEDYDNEQKQKWKGYTTTTPIYDKIQETLVPMAQYAGKTGVEIWKQQDTDTNLKQLETLGMLIANPASTLAVALGTVLGERLAEKTEKSAKTSAKKAKEQKQKDYNIKKEQAAAKKATKAAKEKVKKDTKTTSSGKKTTSKAAMNQMSQARKKSDSANKKATKNANSKKSSSKKSSSKKSSSKKSSNKKSSKKKK